jgi:hypothetical protein
MVNYALIQSKINAGNQKAANALGQSMQWYRPMGNRPAIDPDALMGSILVYLDPTYAFDASKPSQYGKPQFGALFDRTLTLVGDYLVGPQGTYYIASQQDLLPTQVIQCNRVVSVLRQTGGQPSFDPAQAYGGGHSKTSWETIYCQFPASVLTKSRGERGDTSLPGDVKLGTYEVLIPTLGYDDTIIKSADRLTDDLGQLYSVSSAEQTPLGWRLLIVATQT